MDFEKLEQELDKIFIDKKLEIANKKSNKTGIIGKLTGVRKDSTKKKENPLKLKYISKTDTELDPTDPDNFKYVEHNYRKAKLALKLLFNPECPVCIEPCATEILPCGHSLCEPCRSSILKQHKKQSLCPICRANFTKQIEKDMQIFNEGPRELTPDDLRQALDIFRRIAEHRKQQGQRISNPLQNEGSVENEDTNSNNIIN